jgi:hypothetical protein
LKEGPRNDAIAHRDQSEAVGHIGLQLAGKRSLRVKLGRVLDAWVYEHWTRRILRSGCGEEEKKRKNNAGKLPRNRHCREQREHRFTSRMIDEKISYRISRTSRLQHSVGRVARAQRFRYLTNGAAEIEMRTADALRLKFMFHLNQSGRLRL